ncbi:MAG: DNA-processing protein DprA [Planctomycetota bacterium]
MTPGVGPVLGRRLLERFRIAEEVLKASVAGLKSVEGIGQVKAERMRQAFRNARALAEGELERCDQAGVRLIGTEHALYPELLTQLDDGPLALWVKGDLEALGSRFTVAIVGSRSCSAYGMEQAERFSTALSQAGLIVVSGGARGIDTAAHRAAVRLGEPTCVVMGCGLGHCYPPENRELFDQVRGAGGVIVSELPLGRAPAADQFPARNRIISGLSLGVIVIEAPSASGALITARQAAEEHGREVMAVPGRIDSKASHGSNNLIKTGSAAMVASPVDVLDLLESPARHFHSGTHQSRYRGGLIKAAPSEKTLRGLTERQEIIVGMIGGGKDVDAICESAVLGAEEVQADLILLELRGMVKKNGPVWELVSSKNRKLSE